MTKVQSQNFDLDVILGELGDFGRFQITNYVFICLPILLSAGFTLSFVFTAGQLDHRYEA